MQILQTMVLFYIVPALVFDKLIWAFLLFVFAPIAVWFFRSYRLAHWPEPVTEPQSSSHPEPVGNTVAQPT